MKLEMVSNIIHHFVLCRSPHRETSLVPIALLQGYDNAAAIVRQFCCRLEITL
jgi:hypothetical protein